MINTPRAASHMKTKARENLATNKVVFNILLYMYINLITLHQNKLCKNNYKSKFVLYSSKNSILRSIFIHNN